jgi:hypothetical protein
MRFKEFLSETYINAIRPADKQKYAEQVWDMLQSSYASLPGGFATAANIGELIDKSWLWKMVKRDGKIVAVQIYKDQYGRKGIAGGTDGSSIGKSEISKIIADDIKLNRSWAEASGSPERIMIKLGAQPVPNTLAAMLTGKEILSLNPDGYHYTRLIAGKPYEKIIFGTVNLPSDVVSKIESSPEVTATSQQSQQPQANEPKSDDRPSQKSSDSDSKGTQQSSSQRQ